MSNKQKNNVISWAWTVALAVISFICIYPFLFMLSSSFKISGDVLSKPMQLIPNPIIVCIMGLKPSP